MDFSGKVKKINKYVNIGITASTKISIVEILVVPTTHKRKGKKSFVLCYFEGQLCFPLKHSKLMTQYNSIISEYRPMQRLVRERETKKREKNKRNE